jgi:hypothetical protein
MPAVHGLDLAPRWRWRHALHLKGAPRIHPHRGAPSLLCQQRMLAHLAQQRVLRPRLTRLARLLDELVNKLQTSRAARATAVAES